MDLRGLALVVGCLTCALAAPLSNPTQCDPKCIAPSGFQEGRTYVYSYSTKTSSYIAGEQYGYSNLTVTCEARLEVIGTCEIVLELTDISVEETNGDGATITSPNEEVFRNHLTSHRLRFGMQAGKVTSVCPQSDEAIWVTNFKRGILSALQLTLPRSSPGTETITESTVSGICETEVTAEDSERVTKTKNFKLCEDRVNSPWLIYGIKLVPQAPTENLMVSEQYCSQEHNGGDYVVFAECKELHILKPLSDQENGPATLVMQTLTFNRVIKAPSNHQLEGVEERKSIVFEHHKHMEESKTDSTVADDLMSQLCDSLSGGVDADTAKLFPAIINEMRRLEANTLAGVLATATCEGYQTSLSQILRDALGKCQSSGCIEIMVNLIQDGTIQDKTVIENWIYPLNFVLHPTKEMVTHLMELAGDVSIRKPLFLAVSSIINKYCAFVNPSCDEEREISTALDYFEDMLGSKCRYQDAAEKRGMMIAIHALGNAGTVSRGLRKCFDSESADISLRIAAIQASAQAPCEEQITQLTGGRFQKALEQQRESLLDILGKTSQDSELRITAYKALMVCPNEEILDFLDSLLIKEKSNQVGGYIVSHLTNIQSSQDPLKAKHRALLEDHPITAKFIDDPMKFSTNFELSWYNETTGYGLAGEGDVIFSSNSFIPRQISLKGQVDALGYAFEAFELGGRMQGMQEVLESAFSAWSSNSEEEEGMRKKRSLIKENKLENVIEDFDVTADDQVEGSIYLQIFGREMMLVDEEDIKAMMVPADTDEYLMQLALLAQGRTYETSKTSLLMENSMSVPLANGLELKLSVNGSSTERFKASGKLNILGMVMKPRSLEIDGTIEPSSAIDISCMMQVDAHCARVGVNYEVSGHTATSLSGKILVEDGSNVQLKLRAPDQKQELISISSKASFLHQEELDMIPSSSLSLTEEKICTGEFLENAVGMRICGESKYHETLEGENPLSGTYQFSLSAEKVEADLESYDVEVSYNLDKKMVGGEKQETDIFHLYFGTPDTLKDRSYGIHLEFERAARELTADLFCPHVGTVHMVGNLMNEENHKRMELVVTTYDGSEYSLYYNFLTTESEEGRNFYPTLRVRTPRFGTLQFLGSVINAENRVSYDMNLQGESRQFVTVNGQTTKVRGSKKSQYDTALTIGGEYVQGGIESSVVVRDDVKIVEVTLSKETVFGEVRSMTISARHRTKGTREKGKRRKGSMDVEEGVNQDFYVTCEFSHSPESSFRLDGELVGTGLTSESTFKFCYGQTTCNSNKKIIVSHYMDFEMEEGNLEGTLSARLQHPYQGTDLVLYHHATSAHGKRNFTLSIVDEAEFVVLASTSLGAEYNSAGNTHQGSVELSLATLGSIKRLNQSWAVQESGEWNGATTLQWQEDQSVVVTSSYTMDSDTRHNMDVVTRYPSGMTHHLHSHVDIRENDVDSQLSFSTNEEERFYLSPYLSFNPNGERSASIRVRTLFQLLDEFEVQLAVNCQYSSSCNSSIALLQFPEGVSTVMYNMAVSHRSTSSGVAKVVAITLPSSSFTFMGMSQNDDVTNEKKAGLSLIVRSDGEEKVFGIEGKVIDNSYYQDKDLFFRLNTTAPYHKNAVEFSLTNSGREFGCTVDIEYSLGRHLTTSVTTIRKQDGFTFETTINAPNQGAHLTLDHTFKEGELFNPHLSLQISPFDAEVTLFDVDFRLSQTETVYGKNGELQLTLIGPDKTLIFSTGVVRDEKGLNYFIEVANEEEIRLRIDLDAWIGVEEKFSTKMELNAQSIYAPEWPVRCGIYLEQLNANHVGAVIYFDINEESLFHFNVSKSSADNLPGIIHQKEVLVRVKLPTSVNANLHDFGMHIGAELIATEDGHPQITGSLSFFWGPEVNQQLTLDVVASFSEDSDGTHKYQGGILLAQPLRSTHLQPEYNVDYNVTKLGPNIGIRMSFDRGDGEEYSLVINHVESERDGHRNYNTSVMATATDGKSFRLLSDITPMEGGKFDSNFTFVMDDEDIQEKGELLIHLDNLSEQNLERVLQIFFEHSPSGMDLNSLITIQNDPNLMYFGVESQSSIPGLESPLDLAFETELDKSAKTLMVHALGPVNDITLRGHVYQEMDGEAKSYHLETNNEINGMTKNLNVRVEYEDRAGDLIIETDQAERTIHFGYLNDSSIQVSLTKDDHENAQTTLTVLNPHTLYTLITWDTTWPQAFKEAARERIDLVKEKIDGTLEEYKEITQTITENFGTYMTSAYMRNGDMVLRMEEIGTGLRERLAEIKENYLEQRRTIKEKFVNFKETVRENLDPLVAEYIAMKNTGNTQLQTAKDHIKDEALAYFEAAERDLSEYGMSVGVPLIEHYWEVRQSIEAKIDQDKEMMENFREKIVETRERLEAEIEAMRESWEASKENFQYKWQEFIEIMSEMINRENFDEMYVALTMNPAYTDSYRIFSELTQMQVDAQAELDSLREIREDRRQLISEDLEALRSMKAHFRTVNNVPSLGIKLCQGELLRNLRDNIKSTMEEKLEKLVEWAIEQNQGYKLLYDMEEGRIEVWIFTDERYDDLISPPVNDPLGSLKTALGRLAKDFPLLADMRKYKSQLYENMDLVMIYLEQVAQPAFDEQIGERQAMNLEDLWGWKAMVNTFFYEILSTDCLKAQAFLVGDQHYKTFDGTYYEFAGKCSFLAAQDFVDNTFTVAVEYGRDEDTMSKSFVVIADGVTMELHGNRVSIDRDEVELPYVVSDTVSITRDVGNIYIKSTKGFTVTYNLPYDILKVELGILYFGKTAGLFGNFNHEPNDDLVDSSGDISEHIDEFARSWEIGKKCTSHLNKASACDLSPALGENFICAEVFLDGLGPASNGHPAVNPEPYYTMCANLRCTDISEIEFGAQLCGIFQSYVQECRSKGLMWINMPKECNYCPVSEEQYVGPYGTYVDVPRGADVVIVLEQKSFMSERSQQIIDLMDKVNTELKREGYRDNRFGVVGFGGAGVLQAAHVESIDGELFGPAQGLLRSLRGMPFDGEGTSDAWEAVSFAMTYPFRAGVAKHIIFMGCPECPERVHSAAFFKTQKAMNDQGIRFTMLTDYTFNLGEKSAKEDDEIFGIDKIGVYTDKLAGIAVDYFKGDPGLLHFVNQPNNPFARLAFGTEGALFSTNSMETKNFKDVFSLWVVKHSLTEETAFCSCVEQSNGILQTICE